MKDGCGRCGDDQRKLRTGETSREKRNNLVTDLLEKEEEIEIYKHRLKELEAAFYYNLELISERDLELNVLEQQLAEENEQLEEVSRERDELKDLIKTLDEKKCRKIQDLEKRLSLKEEEIRVLQRENFSNINILKEIVDDIKQQDEKRLHKMTTEFEMQKKELIRSYRDEMEQRENYYLVEIENLGRKLEQARREKEKLAGVEEEIRDLKYRLKEVEKAFLEKEKYYLEKFRKLSKSCQGKVNKEVQCEQNPQRADKTVQTERDMSVADCQTSEEIPQREEQYEQKMRFLQEQNEVLKFIVKDLKRNREGGGQPPGCECLTRADVDQVNKKFQSEINNLKKILEKELKVRAEEDAVIQSLEASVTCLKDKLLLGLQDKLRQFSGDDISRYIYTREIQVTLLEQKLCQKMDSLISVAEEDRQKVHEQLEEFKKECFQRIDAYLKSREEPTVIKSDNFLDRIRFEMQNLQNKIETDVRNMLGNNCDTNKCYKNAVQEDSEELYHDSGFVPESPSFDRKPLLLCRSPNKLLTDHITPSKFINNLMVGR